MMCQSQKILEKRQDTNLWTTTTKLPNAYETEGKKLEQTEGVFSFNRDCNCPGEFMVTNEHHIFCLTCMLSSSTFSWIKLRILCEKVWALNNVLTWFFQHWLEFLCETCWTKYQTKPNQTLHKQCSYSH